MNYETVLRIVGRIRDQEIRLPGITYAQINAKPEHDALGCSTYSVTLLAGLDVVTTFFTAQQYTDYVNTCYC